MMPRLLKKVPRNRTGDNGLMPGEVADEIEDIRVGLRELADRMERLTWALMTRGVRPGKVRETSDDIPF